METSSSTNLLNGFLATCEGRKKLMAACMKPLLDGFLATCEGRKKLIAACMKPAWICIQQAMDNITTEGIDRRLEIMQQIRERAEKDEITREFNLMMVNLHRVKSTIEQLSEEKIRHLLKMKSALTKLGRQLQNPMSKAKRKRLKIRYKILIKHTQICRIDI